ncbi:hypothetical protein ADIAL_0035 [Alkalibacterium sp. AK22]|uniref:permease prefix domain 1-containing protein n=1 Tax=Alkalibacterium sp. AK22 TaxID=1229520 RepID=UPI00044EFC22|nr:permease prefix domain 1-containing protein [Alkalibacterium sp. AK22]EXJ24469.1 hypothetical protein ADIAL_0035 [Alkalibacterium sp. AK22]
MIIREYVEQMFKSVPLTEETYQLKQDMLANMEDKYEHLIAEGATENEALGVVITEFGNIDELLTEMGIRKDTEKTVDHYPTMESDAVDGYIKSRQTMGLRIGLGVWSILTGVGGMLTLFGLAPTLNMPGVIGVIFLLPFLIIGIGLLIMEGLRSRDLQAYQSPFVLLPDLRDEIADRKKAYEKSLAFSIMMGVALCILSFVPLLIGLWTTTLSVLPGIGLMLVLIGIGVVFFVYGGNSYYAFTVLLENGKDPACFEEAVKADKRMKKLNYIIDEIYWPVIVLVYLGLGFIIGGNVWSWSWILFVLGGILEDTVKALFESIYKS